MFRGEDREVKRRQTKQGLLSYGKDPGSISNELGRHR